MSAMELDPNFVKALRLLRSKSKDSTAQLKAMLDEAIRQRKGQLGPGPRSPSLTKQHSESSPCWSVVLLGGWSVGLSVNTLIEVTRTA